MCVDLEWPWSVAKMLVNPPAVWPGGAGDSVEEKFHLVHISASGATRADCGECPGYLLLANEKRARERGGLIKVRVHLGLQPYWEDQKQLTEVVICCVDGEKQHVGASELWFTVHGKESLLEPGEIHPAEWRQRFRLEAVTGVSVICLFFP